MTQKIVVTKAGKDAISSTTPDDFYLDSNYPLLKVHAYGTFSTNIVGLATIEHNLGYKPFALVFSQYVDTDGMGTPILSDEYYQHDWFQAGATVNFYGYTQIFDDRLEITIGNTDDGGRPGVIDGFYYIFKDSVS